MAVKNLTGRDVIPALAEIYGQLYISPRENGEALYRDVVLKGLPVPEKRLDHFLGSEDDRLDTEHTPAGDATVITLGKRSDFETFLRIMCNRCTPVLIPATQGAVHVSGIINRGKVDAFAEEWTRQHPDASAEDWSAAFQEFQKNKENYTDTLIILSTGLYSAVPASEMRVSEAEWRRLSLIIRRTHECTHFVCRKLFPSQVNAVWDELVADAAGLYAAFGRYEPARAERLLGIRNGRWEDGRLKNYCPDSSEADLQVLSERIHSVLLRFEELFSARQGQPVYGLVRELEFRQAEWWP